MSVSDCLLKAGITLRDQAEMFDLPVDRNLPDEELANAVRALGYDPEKLTPQKIENARFQLKQKFYQQQQQAKAQLELKKRIDSYPEQPERALAAIITNDVNEISGNVGVEKRAMALVNLTHAKIHEFMNAMAPSKWSMFTGIFTNKAINKEQKALMDDVVEEMFGTNTNNPEAAKFAKSLSAVLDDLHNRYKALTGDFRKLKDWGLPQRHDPIKVGKASFDEWLAYVSARLDMDKMKQRHVDLDDPDTFRAVMKSVYDNIRTDGLARIDERPFSPGNSGEISPTKVWGDGSKKVSSKHKDARFLQFKDGKAWREYQDAFGSGSIYQTVTDHVMGMSREIALMETFGPDPKAGFNYIKSVVEKRTGNKLSTRLAGAYFDTFSNVAIEAPTKTAQLLQSIRNWNVATKLGSAVLSAQTDHAFAYQTALYNGLSYTRMMKKYISQLASRKNREEAARVALTAEYALDRLSAAFEYQNSMATGKAKSVADFVMRISGMEAHTVAMRQAFGMEFLQALAEVSGKSFNDLPEKMKKAMGRYGIDEEKWSKISEAKTDFKGVPMIDPNKIADPDTQQVLVGMILTETDFAVPTPGVRERTFASLGTDAGTVHGEVVRSLTQFMSFPITVQMRHLFGRAGANRSQSGASKLGYASSVAVTSTLLGALVLQAKNIAAGKTTEDWEEPEFWARAADQGGYFGLVGSFLLDTQGYYSGYSGGPVIDGPVKDLAYTLVAGNVNKIREGQDTTLSKDATNFLIKNFPGNNIWYARLAMDRAIFDELRARTDPDYRKKLVQRMRDMREKDQEYWWKPEAR